MSETMSKIVGITLFAALIGVGVVAADTGAGLGVVEFSVVESVYYVFGSVYWYWIGVAASAWD